MESSKYDEHFGIAERLLEAVESEADPTVAATTATVALAHATLANAAANHVQAEADSQAATAGERLASAITVGDEFAEGRLQVGGVRA